MTLSKERKDYLTKIADQITFELCRDLKVDEWTSLSINYGRIFNSSL